MEKNPLKKYFPIFVLPTLIAFILFFLVPFVMGLYLSFTNFTTISNAMDEQRIGAEENMKVSTMLSDALLKVNGLAKQQKEYASNLGKTIEGVVANSQSVWLVIQEGGQTMTTLLESVDVVKDMVGQNRSAAEKMETQINRFVIN